MPRASRDAHELVRGAPPPHLPPVLLHRRQVAQTPRRRDIHSTHAGRRNTQKRPSRGIFQNRRTQKKKRFNKIAFRGRRRASHTRLAHQTRFFKNPICPSIRQFGFILLIRFLKADISIASNAPGVGAPPHHAALVTTLGSPTSTRAARGATPPAGKIGWLGLSYHYPRRFGWSQFIVVLYKYDTL